MTLIGAILNKVRSQESLNKKYVSPPPEMKVKIIRKKPIDRYSDVKARVDTSPPIYDPTVLLHGLETWQNRFQREIFDNMNLLTIIKTFHFTRGKVDSRWKHFPEKSRRGYEQRCHDLKIINTMNKVIYKRLINATPKIDTTKELLRDWRRNRRMMVEQATMPFLLFPPIPQEIMEDAAFAAPPGVKRIRVYLKLGIKDGATLGDLAVELFSEACPSTCRLFRDLLEGDGVGYGYVGTRFYTKVPGLYWSGGDVVHNNGFGCYAQKGRTTPIGAENYHFPHSMPGLLSMKMTCDDEMCGSFNITFKTMPQFDLKNVVFGRVVRPSHTFEIIKDLGTPLNLRPIVEVVETRYRRRGQWVCGERNAKLIERELIYKGRF